MNIAGKLKTKSLIGGFCSILVLACAVKANTEATSSQSNNDHLRTNYNFINYMENFETLSQQSRYVGIFMASMNSQGRYWCPDCENAKHNIFNILLPDCEAKNIPAVIVDVGDPRTWRDRNHPLRTNPELRINNIPTIALFENGKMTKRLVESSIFSVENVNNFLADKRFDSEL